jgi:hypothetical protein
VTPTRPGVLLQLVLGFALLVYVLAALAYSDLPRLPGYAPVSIVLLAVAEVGIARVVRDRLSVHRQRRAGAPVLGRTLHPVQVARAAVLAKASSAGGAVLLGCYAGLLAWTLPRASRVAVMEQDALVAGLSALASAGLVLAALALERACRTPGQDDDRDGAPA